MPRSIAFLVILAAALIGALYFLSTTPTKRPTSLVETEVNLPGNAQ